VLQRAGLVLRENDDLSCPLSKPFEQPLNPFSLAPRPIVPVRSGATERLRDTLRVRIGRTTDFLKDPSREGGVTAPTRRFSIV
jgi:hypothetical protein